MTAPATTLIPSANWPKKQQPRNTREKQQRTNDRFAAWKKKEGIQ